MGEFRHVGEGSVKKILVEMNDNSTISPEPTNENEMLLDRIEQHGLRIGIYHLKQPIVHILRYTRHPPVIIVCAEEHFGAVVDDPHPLNGWVGAQVFGKPVSGEWIFRLRRGEQKIEFLSLL
jgi:hypothetical protein